MSLNKEDNFFKRIVELKLLSIRVCEVVWAICKLRGYDNLQEFVNDVFSDNI
jgi:hypothetical protein